MVDDREVRQWEDLMRSARNACRIGNKEFEEPEFLDWPAGRRYLDDCWAVVRRKR